MNAIVNPTGAANGAAKVRTMLDGKAFLASVTVRGWSARRLDKSVSDETNASHGAAADASRVNKLLISKESLAELTTISNQVRDLFYRLTLPWMDSGVRILPSANYLEFANGMRDLQRKHASAVATFLDAYPSLRDDARARLSAMFKAEDYPPESDIARRFYCGFKIERVSEDRGNAEDFRLQLGETGVELLRADLESSMRATVQAATADIFARVADAVRRIAETLPAYKPATDSAKASGTFRDSLVQNVRDLVATLPALNVFDDPSVQAIGARLAELAKAEPDALREDSNLRSETANAAAAILSAVESYI